MSQPALDLAAPDELRIRFEPVEHRYFIEPSGEEWPGVTRALEACRLVDFSMVPRHILEAAQIRGTDVHNALHYLDDGELDRAALSAQMAGYVEAYERFKHDMRFTVLLVEHFVHNARYRWAGRLDRVGLLENKHGGQDAAVVDFKSGLVVPAHRIQLAAYTSGLADPRAHRRITLELDDNTKYKVHEYEAQTYARDLNAFHAAVALWHWTKEFGR